ATTATQRLEDILVLTKKVPLALAVVPAGMTTALATALANHRNVTVLQHGWQHANHAPPSAPPAEIGGQRSLATVADELRRGRERLIDAFEERFIPVLVPPWHQIAPELVPMLPGIGFRGLSNLGWRPRHLVTAGLVQANVHVDPIAWELDGRFG